MSWITAIWSASAGACLVMALLHLHLWLRDRSSWANLCFATMVATVMGFIAFELISMRTESVEIYRQIMRWTPPLFAVGVIGTLGFVHFYFGTGRTWLLAGAIGLRALVLAVTPLAGLNLHVSSISTLASTTLLGERVSIPGEWAPSPWILLAQVAALAHLAYIVDATARLWRQGDAEARRRAIIVGGSLILFFVITPVYSVAVASGGLRLPFIVSLPFLVTLLAMSSELSGQMLRTISLGRALRARERELELAAESADLGFWTRNVANGQIHCSARWRRLLGFAADESIDLEAFMSRLHLDDRPGVDRALNESARGDGRYEMEYRVVRPDGQTRWIASVGRYEFDPAGRPLLLRGVSLDITERKQAALELQQRKDEVAHLSRVTTLGEISGSLAHELNQPLGAILSNAEAAELQLKRTPIDLEELRAILADIRRDDLRASEILTGIRDFLRRQPAEFGPVALPGLVRGVARLIGPDLASRHATLAIEIPDDLPEVNGDRVQLQQVMLNLVVNGLDAMAACPADRRRLTLRAAVASPETVTVSITDLGAGIPPERIGDLFEAFRTTKPGGLGLGLTICRSILEAHGGTISLENNAGPGATARLTLPVFR
ncbi:MAG: PAS domain-containing protein [Opitutaceae bacterium]|nr:PAS domain-containing protein [Opitutaceae bacterium]